MGQQAALGHNIRRDTVKTSIRTLRGAVQQKRSVGSLFLKIAIVYPVCNEKILLFRISIREPAPFAVVTMRYTGTLS